MSESDNCRPLTRFATIEEAMSEPFMTRNGILHRLAVKYELPDHSDLNRARYPWTVPISAMPALYGSRMWEYPFALLAAELKEGMRCLDVGCGMTAFTIYLKEVAKCDVMGIDPDVFDVGVKYKAYGVSREFARRTGIKVIQCDMASIPFRSKTFDRVFCLSVVEHLEPEMARRGVQELARVIRPQGRLIITVDVNMFSEVSRPLDLIWESGLQPLGAIDLHWPRRRLGVFCDGKQPADVFGMTLLKDDYEVETEYSDGGMKVDVVPGCLVGSLRAHAPGVPPSQRQLWRQIVGRGPGYLWRSVRQRLRLVRSQCEH